MPVSKTSAFEPEGSPRAGQWAGDAATSGDAERPPEPPDPLLAALSSAWSDLDAAARETVVRVAEGLAAARRTVRS